MCFSFVAQMRLILAALRGSFYRNYPQPWFIHEIAFQPFTNKR